MPPTASATPCHLCILGYNQNTHLLQWNYTRKLSTCACLYSTHTCEYKHCGCYSGQMHIWLGPCIDCRLMIGVATCSIPISAAQWELYLSRELPRRGARDTVGLLVPDGPTHCQRTGENLGSTLQQIRLHSGENAALDFTQLIVRFRVNIADKVSKQYSRY